ncbi:MAG: GxxExxY protein [Chlamydiota bacterium]
MPTIKQERINNLYRSCFKIWHGSKRYFLRYRYNSLEPVQNLFGWKVLTINEVQLLFSLKMSDYHRGLLINFDVKMLKDGIQRMRN